MKTPKIFMLRVSKNLPDTMEIDDNIIVIIIIIIYLIYIYICLS